MDLPNQKLFPKNLQGHYQRHQTRAEPALLKGEAAKPPIKLGTEDLWKDRQLRDFSRANGLCFKCGENFDPTHQCLKKTTAELQLTQTETDPDILSDEILNMIEENDMAQAEQLSLSIHAISRTIRLRALIGNQVLLILVDSGSSNSFINANIIDRL